MIPFGVDAVTELPDGVHHPIGGNLEGGAIGFADEIVEINPRTEDHACVGGDGACARQDIFIGGRAGDVGGNDGCAGPQRDVGSAWLGFGQLTSGSRHDATFGKNGNDPSILKGFHGSPQRHGVGSLAFHRDAMGDLGERTNNGMIIPIFCHNKTKNAAIPRLQQGMIDAAGMVRDENGGSGDGHVGREFVIQVLEDRGVKAVDPIQDEKEAIGFMGHESLWCEEPGEEEKHEESEEQEPDNHL